MRIRFYQPKTVKPYRSHLSSLHRWFGAPPHRLTREDVREYLLYLVDAGASSSTVSNHLAAIRTAFDKMCLRQVTLGLAVPRKPKRLPVVLSVEEIKVLLQAAPSLRDKLLLGLVYANLYHTPAGKPKPKRRRADVGQLRLHFLQQPTAANCRCA